MLLADAKASFISDNSQLLSESAAKIKAVLALILGQDKQAAEFCLISLISRVYKKEGAFLIGNLPLNLTSVSKESSQLLQ